MESQSKSRPVARESVACRDGAPVSSTDGFIGANRAGDTRLAALEAVLGARPQLDQLRAQAGTLNASRASAPAGGGSGAVAQLTPFETRAGTRDTDIGYEALHQELLPALISGGDGHGMGRLYVALSSEPADEEGHRDLLLEQIEMAARVLMAHLMGRPDALRLARLGVLTEERIKFWLSTDYAQLPPHNLAIGIIAESLSAEIQLAKHGAQAEIVSGLKVGVPDPSKRDGFRAIAEIDNLTVLGGPRGLAPVELVEVKAGVERAGMQLTAKKAKLRKVVEGEARLYLGGVDVTDQYDLSGLREMTTISSTSAANSDQPLDRDEIDQLYEELIQLQYSGYESLRVLAL